MNKNNSFIFTVTTISVVFIIASWLVSGFVLYDIPDRAEIGDMFGVINALFSGLGLAGLICTLLLQRQAISDQEEQIEKQNFENGFIQLLNIHNALIESLRIKDTDCGILIQGRDCFSYLLEKLSDEDAVYKNNDNKFQISEDFLEKYQAFINKYDNDFGHYMRSLYQLLKYVDDHYSQRRKSDGSTYYKMIRAQLTSNELQMIFFNCCFHKTKEVFNQRIENSALLKYIPDGHYYKSYSRQHSILGCSAFGCKQALQESCVFASQVTIQTAQKVKWRQAT